MRRHAKASTAGSTQRQASGLGRSRFVTTAALAVAIAALLALAATPASAALQRNYESSFGSFSGESPQGLAVDQSNGDVYVIDAAANQLKRYSSAGAPKNFTAGPGAGTNAIGGFSLDDFNSIYQVAVDNSGGPSDGNIYLTLRGGGEVKVYASSGEPLGSLTGTGTPAGAFGDNCGVAVDQANGDVYIASFEGKVWRYSPSGATVAEGDYSGGIAVPYNPCQLAVAKGSIYVHGYQEWTEGAGPLRKYATSAFALGAPPSPTATTVVSSAFAVAADPGNGDVYVDEGSKVSVFNAAGSNLYTFGQGEIGTFSAGVAVRAGGNAYVSDKVSHEIDVYGTPLDAGKRATLFSFGSFSGESPQGLAVDQSNGDVYVIDVAANQLKRYSSAGAPKNFTAGPGAGTNAIGGFSLDDFPTIYQVAVDNSGGPSDGNVYLTVRGTQDVRVFASSGEPLGSLTGTGTPAGAFGENCGIAVDQANGDVYIASFEGKVWRYSPSGATVAEGDYSGGIAVPYNPCQLAVAQGTIYVHAYQEFTEGAGPLRKYATSAFTLGAPPSPTATTVVSSAFAVATDPSNGDVYVDEGSKVSVFNAAGSNLYTFGQGEIGTFSAGVAVRAGGNAYVSDKVSHEIDVYGPFSAPPPLVETKPVRSIKHTKATLHGHLDPNGSLPIVSCEFEWGTDTNYSGTPVPCVEGGSFTAAADVSAVLTGLTPGTTYHFRLHVTTTSGGFSGEDGSFETIPPSAVPEVSPGKGAIVTATSSLLKGSVNPNANPLTACRFEYVDDLAFQASGFSDLSSGGEVPCDQAPGSIPVDFEDHDVSATASGLNPEQIYRFRLVAENASGAGNSKEALVPGPPLVETTGSTWRTATTARLDSRVSPHGADTTYHFEYVSDAQFQANGFDDALSTSDSAITTNEVQQIRRSDADFTLSFDDYTTPPISADASAADVQAALRALPSIGSPNVRVTLPSLIDKNFTVTFVGALGDTDIGELAATSSTFVDVETRQDGGPGSASSFVSAPLANLQPNTTYRYRVVADNGTPGGPSFGEDMTLTTRASDAALSHGAFPGPPGSDRAWEQVNVPDTGSNPIQYTLGFSDNGDRAIYSISGGSPGSEVGSFNNQLFAERTASGWKSRFIHPSRTQAQGNSWTPPAGPSDLSQLFSVNTDITTSAIDVWGLSPDAPAEHLFGGPSALGFGGYTIVSEDGSRVIVRLESGSYDPDHPTGSATPNAKHLYDISTGTPRMVSLLPDGSVPNCGVLSPPGTSRRVQHLVSADGSLLFFEAPGSACTNFQLYVRDIEAETTSLVSPTTGQNFLRSTDDAAFFITGGSLDPEDEGGQDVYRYDLDDESLECVTCFPGLVTDVISSEGRGIAIADDGSRLYFNSPHRLLPGAASDVGAAGLYRVDVATGDLAYVASAASEGDQPIFGNAISPDGATFIFRTDAPGLNSQNGPQNGDTRQLYRYDDDDRSVVCVSCPTDGSPPRGEIARDIAYDRFEVGPNLDPLSSAGDVAFTTSTALLPADQNTAPPGRHPGEGMDIYEWRNGRLLLITDGLTASEISGANAGGPEVAGITPDGRSIFFAQRARLTPDAIDGFRRLYVARIGGGFDFPTPSPPCPLEACQGVPKGIPGESRPGTLDFSGAGNAASRPPARCRKGKVRRRGRCVARKHKPKRAKRSQHKANNDRRASR